MSGSYLQCESTQGNWNILINWMYFASCPKISRDERLQYSIPVNWKIFLAKPITYGMDTKNEATIRESQYQFQLKKMRKLLLQTKKKESETTKTFLKNYYMRGNGGISRISSAKARAVPAEESDQLYLKMLLFWDNRYKEAISGNSQIKEQHETVALLN